MRAMALLTDSQIAQLISEAKHLPADYLNRLQLRTKRGHRERDLDIEGDGGSRFRIVVRESDLNPLDFSVILAYYMPTTNRLFRLRRYNGRHGEHTNRIENQTFEAFHVHVATERYQDLGAKEESFAQVTDRYATVTEAMACMVADCAFVVDEPRVSELQLRLLPQELD
jgi:hypothetical protein